MGGDIAATSCACDRAARNSGIDCVIHNQSADRIAKPLRGIIDLLLPNNLTGRSFKHDDLSIECGQNNLIAIERDAILLTTRLIALISPALRQFREGMLIFPDQIARLGIERIDDGIIGREEHHAIMHKRSAFLLANVRHGIGPSQLKILHIGLVDLVQRAIALIVQRTAPAQPFLGCRLKQHFSGHGLVRAGRRLRKHSRARHGQSGRCEKSSFQACFHDFSPSLCF